MTDFQLERNALGRLCLTNAAGEVFENVVPVRAFPIGAPLQGLSLVSSEGRELVWISALAELETSHRELIESELASREFMPRILGILQVSGYVTPCTWHVNTDRGETDFILKGEEDIRRLTGSTYLIADSHGIQFLLPDLHALDRRSRKILDRFL